MGSNLPPGVSDSMIPGNTPEDHEWEDLFEWMVDQGLDPKSIKGMLIIQHKLSGPDGLYGRLQIEATNLARLAANIPPLWRPKPLTDLLMTLACLEIIGPLTAFEQELADEARERNL